MTKLSAKQERFCKEYITHFNARKAAVSAKYSKKTANEQASRLLTKVHIQQRIAELQKNINQKLEVNAEMVIKELQNLAFYNVQDLVNSNNGVLNLKRAKRDILKPVVGIKVTERFTGTGDNIERIVTTELKLVDKTSPLVHLGKHFGIFKEDNQQKNLTIKVTRK